MEENIVEKTNEEIIEEADKNTREKIDNTEKESFLQKATNKFIDIKDAVVEAYKQDPQWFKGLFVGGAAALTGFYVGHKFVEHSLSNRPYYDFEEVDDGVYKLTYGYNKIFGGPHKFFEVTGNKEYWVKHVNNIVSCVVDNINKVGEF